MTLNEARTVLTKELNNVYDSDELKNIIELGDRAYNKHDQSRTGKK